jgi:glucose/arabinose dehydrogenase
VTERRPRRRDSLGGAWRRGARATTTSRRLAAVTLAACGLLAGCAFGSPPPDDTGAPPNLPTPSQSATSEAGGSPGALDVVASKLSAPWGLAFLPDGSALVTERATAKILRVGRPATPAGLTVTTLGTVRGVTANGDGGLLGVAVSPRYSTDSLIYVYYSTGTDNRIGSLKVTVPPQDDGSSSPAPPAPSAPPATFTPQALVTGVPHGTTDNGGALAFGPDGLLYASTGDAGKPASSQDAKNLAGKILRMTASGKPATGNPTKDSLIYASGLHNVEGLAWGLDDQMYAVDAGRSEDALRHITAGANYGWTVPGGKPAKPAPVAVQTWPLRTSTCAGVAVVDATLTTACLSGARVWVLQLTSHGTPFGAPMDVLTGQYGRLRDVVAAPDGSLWVTTSNTDSHGDPGPDDDRIIRIVLNDAGAGKT